MSAEWIDKNDLSGYYEEMETWTKIAIDHYLQ
jgi:predicted NUDIX family phosphoesterase